jgi:hypothetical protein
MLIYSIFFGISAGERRPFGVYHEKEDNLAICLKKQEKMAN